MSTITVIHGYYALEVDEDVFAIVKMMVEELPTPVRVSDMFEIVTLLRAEGYEENAAGIALAAKSEVERDSYWTDQALDDAHFAEHGVQ